MKNYRIQLALSSVIALTLPALGADKFAAAVALYNKGDYAAAAPLFQKLSAGDVNAMYYYGLTLQHLGDMKHAREMFEKLARSSPNTQAGTLSRQALNLILPGQQPQSTARPAPPPSAPAALSTQYAQPASHEPVDISLPEQAKVYFQPAGRVLMVDAYVNNRPVKMVFDTGAEFCAFGRNQLAEMGIQEPRGQATGAAQGVGDEGQVSTWEMRVDLKVGNIERRNFPISIQNHLSTAPLLGQTFFSDFQYTIDNGANCIQFVRKDRVAAHASSNYSVPFTRSGRDLVVKADIDGRTVDMYFDTGAASVCFSYDQCSRFGIRIPDDAQPYLAQGVGGVTRGVTFELPRLRLGPIDKSNVSVAVLQGYDAPLPLLGQTFFNDWQFTIDNANSQIHFVRR